MKYDASRDGVATAGHYWESNHYDTYTRTLRFFSDATGHLHPVAGDPSGRGFNVARNNEAKTLSVGADRKRRVLHYQTTGIALSGFRGKARADPVITSYSLRVRRCSKIA